MRTKLFFILLITSLLGGRTYAQFETTQLVITEGIEDQEVKAQMEEPP